MLLLRLGDLPWLLGVVGDPEAGDRGRLREMVPEVKHVEAV